MNIKRIDQLCKRCLKSVIENEDESGFLQRRLDNGFCIYNVQSDGKLHFMLGDATRTVPTQCPYGAEQAVSQMTDEERAEQSRETLRQVECNAIEQAKSKGWKFSQENKGQSRVLTFTPPKGKKRVRIVELTEQEDRINNEIIMMQTTLWKIMGRM